MKRIFLVALASAVGILLQAQDLTIIHLNDTHSHIEPERSGINKGKGGVIEQAAYIDSVRFAEGKGNVLLLHAGDFSQGTSYFTELGGDIEIDVLNAMDFDAVCLGNHEFDNGMDELARRLRNLDVPVLCANYDFSGTPLEGLVKPYTVLYKSNRKVGVIGLLTDLSTVVDSGIADILKYKHPAQVAEKYASELKEKGCELVICLTHLGYEGETYTDPELAAETSNVDIIVGGHSHTFMEDLAKVRNLEGKEVVIVTDGKWGLEIGHLTIDFQKNRLTQEYESLKDKGVFKTGGEWFPFPDYSDRKAWEAIVSESSVSLIRNGEKYLDYQWRVVPASAYLAFERTGDRVVMESPLMSDRQALNSLFIAELAEGKGRFIDQIIDGVWHICHQASWVLSAHLPRQTSKRVLPDPDEQIIDLCSADVGAMISLIWHFLNEEFDKVDPVISKVMKYSVRKQILDPYFEPRVQRSNWWKAYDITSNYTLNNWNPWCNSDVILCFLLMEDDQERLDQALLHSAKSVDKFLAYVKSDGACEEGPAYWGHAAGKLYDYLRIMYDASKGEFSIFDDPQIRNMGEYISRSYVQDRWVVNFADASARLSHSPTFIYNYGKAVGSEEMMDFAVFSLGSSKGRFVDPSPIVSKDSYRYFESLRYLPEIRSKVNGLNTRISSGENFNDIMKELRRHVPAFTWYPETEFCYMLNQSGWFLATKGGHNNESHNHNDVGTFILYVDGTPMFIDAGVGTYSKKTFSSERYTIWSMCSDWHNLPVINGVTQKNGRYFHSSEARAVDGRSQKYFSLDISEAYPDDASCDYWKREYKMTDKNLVISDSYSLSERKSADVENLMVQGSVFMPGQQLPSGYTVKSGEVVVANGNVSMSVTYPKSLNPSVETVELDDNRFTYVWGKTLRKISFTSGTDAPAKGKYIFTIKRID